MQKTYSALAWILGTFMVFIIYKANTGDTIHGMQYVRTMQHGDKVAHFILFGSLSFLLNMAFALKQFEFGRYTVYRGSLLVGLFVVVEELSQRHIATRTFEYYDLLADFSGIIVFLVPTIIMAKRIAAKQR